MARIAMLTVHACPRARLGSKETGGMNVYVRELSAELARLGHRLDVFTRRTDPDDPIEVDMAPGVRLVHLEAGQVATMDKNVVLGHLPQFVAGLEDYRRARGVRYDLVHSHYWLSAHAGAELAQRWGAPHVTMFHTLGEVKNRCGAPGVESTARIAIERRVIATADGIVAASEDELGHMVDLYGADPSRVTIIPCGVNTRRFRPLGRKRAKRALGLDGRWTVLFVGRMDPLKGLDLLLHAAHRLADQAPDLQIVVVGGDAVPESEEARVHDLTACLGLEGRVRFVGAVEQALLPQYYSAAEVCVVPSYYESFGLVAVEALACGTPVIASRVGGLPKVVKHGLNGLLVSERSAETFAASIASLYADESWRLILAAGARDSIQHLLWSSIARRVGELYDTLITPTAEPIHPVDRASREPVGTR